MPNDRHYSPARSRSPSRRRDDDRERLKTYPRGRDYRHSRRSRSRSKSPPRSRSRSVGPRRKRGERSRSKSRRRRVHSRSRSRSRDRRNRDHSRSTSSGDERRRKKRNKDRKRSRSREKKKEEKRKKKEKKDKASLGSARQSVSKTLGQKNHGSSSSSWGRYGVISEADMFTKNQEFHTWLVEERKINPERISKDQSRKEFARFVEDYNTATLPHEKYYDIASYERHMTALKEGEFLPPDDSYDPRADLKVLNNAHKRKPADEESFLSKEQLMELRKVQHERMEVGKMKLLGMEVKQNMGVRMDVEYM